ncbi:DUF4367 domain-containing protein [Sporosarcina sp. NPDC096371]|uniref:DUF4367 domain-containing protein n=1 Tax=Sporosarcina sp. NPDC096371 TaxID=3364530 RepID=UPI003812605C
MSNKKKQNLDQLIRESLEEDMMEFPPPTLSSTEAWERMETARREIRQSSRGKRLPKKAILAVASIFMVLGVAAYPQEGGAHSRWSEIFHQVQGSVVQVFGGSGEPIDNPSEESGFFVIEDSEPVMREMDLREAQKVADFTIHVPVVPSGFRLDKVMVMQEGEQMSNEVYLHYVKGKSEFIVAEKKLNGQYAFGAAADSEDTEVEEVSINGQTANILSFKDGVRRITWMTQTSYLYIEGKLTKKEIVEMAQSM